MKMLRFLSVICALAVACVPASPPASPPSAPMPSGGAPPAGDSGFARFVDEYFAAKFAFEPSNATSTGIHDHDEKLEDRSRERIAARVAELKAFLSRLEAFDASRLSADDAIDAEAIEGQIRGDLLDLETLKIYEVNPMAYAFVPGGAVDGLMKREFAPAAQRLRSAIARMRQVPALYAAARANVQNPPKEFTDLAIRMTKGSAGFFEGSVAAWAKIAAGSDAALLREFTETNAAVVGAARDFAAWLEKDLLPRSRGQYAIGEANFLAKLEYDDMVEMPLADLLAKGEAQLAKDYAAFVETAKKIDPNRTPAQVMQALSDTHPTPDQLIPAVSSSVEGARRFLIERQIVTVPSEVRVRIAETPPYARSGGFASMDTPGPFETKATEAFYYVTPVESDWEARHKEEHLRLFNPWVIAIINVHEAYPGHYLQFLYAPRFPTKTRKLIACGTNAEGWAHYAEQMMVEEGFGGEDPRYRLAQLQEALLRDARYVVGIKLHTAGWTVEQGAKLFEEKAFQEPANAFEESRRGSYNPTYLYYTLGKLEIYALRDEYRRAKNASMREFHDAFVAQGALPIPLVRRILLR